MNKTIYIRDEDVSVWDRAKELAGDKLAPVIVQGLKKFIAEKEVEATAAKGFERLELKFNDSMAHYIPKKKAFVGRWLYAPDKPADFYTQEGDRAYRYAVALTAKGNVVIYSWEEDGESQWNNKFEVFPSLEAAAANNDTNNVARKAIRELGVPVEELDI